MSCDVLHSSPGGVWTSDSAHSLARQSSSDHASSLFPVNNPALVHGRWEDDIIWDSEAVPRIPRPIIPRLDPNDPHVILGIPEEPTANLSSEKEGKKVVTYSMFQSFVHTLYLPSSPCRMGGRSRSSPS